MRYLIPIISLIGITLLILLAKSLGNTDLLSTETFRLLFIFNILFIAALVLLIAIQIFRLLNSIKKEIVGSKLTLRLVISFALMVIIPVSIVYLVSVNFLTKSINSWFDVKVESALEGGLSLGQKTLNILMRDIELKGRSIAYTIGNTSIDEQGIVLRDMREKFNLEEVVIYDNQLNILALSSANDSQIPVIPKYEDIERSANEFYGVIEEVNDRILLRAYLPIISNQEIELRNTFLEIKQLIPSEITNLALSVESVYDDYKRLAYSRKSLNIIYTLTLTLVLMLAILSAVAISFVISRRFSEPLSQLASATKEISKGNFKKTIPEQGKKDELGLLVTSFNSMTKQLDSATQNAEKNQHRLELSRMFLDTILTNLSSGVIVIDQAMRIRLHNPAGLKNLQLGRAKVTNKILGEVLSKNNKIYKPIIDYIYTHVKGKTSIKGFSQEFKIIINDKEKIIRVQMNSIKQDGDLNFILLLDDITEVTEGQRHQAWSEVARRLAHEIKNPLTPIQLSAERVEHKLKNKLNKVDKSILSKATHTIINQVNALKVMVNEFSDYARPAKIEKTFINIDLLINDVKDLYEAVDIEINYEQPQKSLFVHGDENKLRQVLVNLIDNAKDAMNNIKNPLINLRIEEHKNELYLIVKDNGTGVSKDVISNIFEPYVTSKSHGTGLGLAIVLKIIDEHNGTISIKNNKDMGTTVLIKLPLIKNEKS